MIYVLKCDTLKNVFLFYDLIKNIRQKWIPVKHIYQRIKQGVTLLKKDKSTSNQKFKVDIFIIAYYYTCELFKVV